MRRWHKSLRVKASYASLIAIWLRIQAGARRPASERHRACMTINMALTGVVSLATAGLLLLLNSCVISAPMRDDESDHPSGFGQESHTSHVRMYPKSL